MSLADTIWYEKSLLAWGLRLPLLPFSGLFRLCSGVRRVLYASGTLSSDAPALPVIIVGGISAGGAGKTPLCVALLEELKRRGYKPGLLTRGYRSRCRSYPHLVKEGESAALCGDEPTLIFAKTGCPVVLDPRRVRGAHFLAFQGVDVIVCDDGLQHYALARDVEILVIDGERRFGNGHLLPAGPLREGPWRAETVDAVVVNGALAHIGNFSMRLKPHAPQPLNAAVQGAIPRGAEICALAGIGNPARFYRTVEELGFKVAAVLRAGDHGRVSDTKLRQAAALHPVVMTRKDAVKYAALECDNLYVIDIEADLNPQFYNLIENRMQSKAYKIKERALKHGTKDAAAGPQAQSRERVPEEPVSAFSKAPHPAYPHAPIFDKVRDDEEVSSLFTRQPSSPSEHARIFDKADFDREVTSQFGRVKTAKADEVERLSREADTRLWQEPAYLDATVSTSDATVSTSAAADGFQLKTQNGEPQERGRAAQEELKAPSFLTPNTDKPVAMPREIAKAIEESLLQGTSVRRQNISPLADLNPVAQSPKLSRELPRVLKEHKEN